MFKLQQRLHCWSSICNYWNKLFINANVIKMSVLINVIPMHPSGLHFLTPWLRRRSRGLCGGVVSLLCYGTPERVQALWPRSTAFYLLMGNMSPVADKLQYTPSMPSAVLPVTSFQIRAFVRLQCSTWPPGRLQKLSYPQFTFQSWRGGKRMKMVLR